MATTPAARVAAVEFERPEPPPPPPMVRVAGGDELPTPPARVPYFFSPEPPPLGAIVDRVAPLTLPAWDAPAELSKFVGEPFYALLGLQLAEKNLSGRQRRQLDEYAELRARVRVGIRARTREDNPPIDQPTLESAALEEKAEALRRLLYSDALDWDRHRWFSVGAEPSDAPAALVQLREALLLRAAANLVGGLSLVQRRLLLELTLELGRGPRALDLAVPAVKPGAVVFFLPETSRFEIPAGLPEPVLAELERFVRKKHEMKRQIAREVLRLDRVSEGKRDRALADFAQRQAPEIAELEQQAEALRHSLAHVPPETTAALGDDVRKLAAEYVGRREALQAELRTRLQGVRRELLTYAPGVELLQWNSTIPGGTYVMASGLDDSIRLAAPAAVDETPQQKRRAKMVTERLKQTVEKYASDTAKQRTDLEVRRVALFQHAARSLGHTVEDGQPLPPEIAKHVAAALQVISKQNRAPDYAEYRVAMLQPGLCPADRRVLFNAALERLELPLPPGVRRPVGRFEAP